MQTSQQSTQRQEDKIINQSDEIKAELRTTFINPICKQTYNALPKIYGKKKKHSKALTQMSQGDKRTKLKNLSQKKHNFITQTNQKEDMHILDKNQKTVKKYKNSLSEPKQCTKKNCSCHHTQQQLQKKQKARLKFNSTTVGRMRLPQIQKFELQDLQSKHKVSMRGLATDNDDKKGLKSIIQQETQKSQNVKKTSSKLQKTNQNFNNIYNLNKTYNKIFKAKHKIGAKINKIKFQISQESDEQNSSQNSEQNNMSNLKYSERYKTQQPHPPSFSKSVMINSQSIFKRTKTTKFGQLNTSLKKIQNKLVRKPSQLSNGFFRVPQQKQYLEYISGYKNIKQDFNLKLLFKYSNFKIIKSEKGVYFGQVDSQMRKSGLGIQVMEKQIFEGRFDEDLKYQGCQRNIDGTFYGRYRNGVRSGFGTFLWNNGQKFEGNWQKGVKCGYGVWTSPKNDKYEGEWLQNRQHGQGVFQHRNSTYKGTFKNFLKDGKGQQTFSNGDIYKGQYKQGKPHGKGRYQWKQGGYYEGQFYQGMREGKGRWVQSDKTIYEGSFKADFKHGFGKQTSSTGKIFQGEFTQGRRKINKSPNQKEKQQCLSK